MVNYKVTQEEGMNGKLVIGILVLSILCGVAFAASGGAQGPNDNANRLINSMRGPESSGGKPVQGKSAQATAAADGDLRQRAAVA